MATDAENERLMFWSLGVWVFFIIILGVVVLPKVFAPSKGAGPQPSSMGGGSGA